MGLGLSSMHLSSVSVVAGGGVWVVGRHDVVVLLPWQQDTVVGACGWWCLSCGIG